MQANRKRHFYVPFFSGLCFVDIFTILLRMNAIRNVSFGFPETFRPLPEMCGSLAFLCARRRIVPFHTCVKLSFKIVLWGNIGSE